MKCSEDAVPAAEQKMAAFLREKNLEQAENSSLPVHPRRSFYARYGKRLLDILISLPVCILLLPIMCLLAVCTYLDVGSPVLFRQVRSGRDGRPFVLCKFRSMREMRDEQGELLPAAKRLTRFGKFMRRSSLDELPNFWSVLKGDMSVIGPRPLPLSFHERMSTRHRMRGAVRPGLECPRVTGGTEEENGYYQLQFENDIWYAENVSLLLDIRMAFLLVGMAFDRAERKRHAEVGSSFAGYGPDGKALSFRAAFLLYPSGSPSGPG